MDLDSIFDAQPTKVDENWGEEILLPILRKQMEEDNISIVKESKIRASSIGGCPRYIVYMLRGFEQQKSAKDVITLELGTNIHEIVQKYLLKTGIVKSLEEKVRMDFTDDAEGSYDGLLEIPGRENELLEIKTMNVEAFERMVLYKKIYPKYKWQANFYMNALGVKKARFLFINRNAAFTSGFAKTYKELNYDPLFLEIEYRADAKIIEQIKERVAQVNEHQKNGTNFPLIRVSQCSYCSVRDLCKKDHEALKQAEKEQKSAEKEAAKPKRKKKNG